MRIKSLVVVLATILALATGFVAYNYRVKLTETVFGYHPEDETLYKERFSIIRDVGGTAELVIIGDSLVERAPWAEMLPGIRISNQGIGGSTVDLVGQRLDLIPFSTRAVILLMGINDLTRQNDSAEVVASEYESVIQSLLSQVDRTIVISTPLTRQPKANPGVLELNHRLQSICAKLGCQYVDVNKVLAPQDILEEEFTFDGVHLSGRGYKELGQVLAGQIDFLPQSQQP